MLVDTGAHTSYLLRGATERLGIPIQQSGQYSFGIGGASVIYSAKLKDFSIGPAHLGKSIVPVVGNTPMQPRFEAIVGADFLLQMDLELALRANYMQFFRATDCRDTFLGYWDKDAMEVPFSGFESDSKKPLVAIELNGVKLQALLDSGAYRTGVTRQAAERAGIKPDSPEVIKAGSAVGIGDAKIATWSARFDNFTIGSETIKNAELSIMDEAPQGRGVVDVILGADFLRAHRVLFAMSQQRLYISYLGGAVFARTAKAAR